MGDKLTWPDEADSWLLDDGDEASDLIADEAHRLRAGLVVLDGARVEPRPDQKTRAGVNSMQGCIKLHHCCQLPLEQDSGLEPFLSKIWPGKKQGPCLRWSFGKIHLFTIKIEEGGGSQKPSGRRCSFEEKIWENLVRRTVRNKKNSYQADCEIAMCSSSVISYLKQKNMSQH